MEDSNKVKTFLKGNKYELMLYGLGTAAILTIVIGQYLAYTRGVKDGVEAGRRTGFHFAVDWFDKEFPDTKLKALWEAWQLANPDKLV